MKFYDVSRRYGLAAGVKINEENNGEHPVRSSRRTASMHMLVHITPTSHLLWLVRWVGS